ncbi:MAG: right-handed parallel beta-helix repeat-containing protein, partial [Nanoarchaeota archaeon]|nr:right-handed parallel beta-helix repeat-containing protein [Nanoarchaeota archaeon]
GSNATIKDNNISSVGATDINGLGIGIHLENSTGNLVSGNIISDLGFKGTSSGTRGITLKAVNDSYVKDHEFRVLDSDSALFNSFCVHMQNSSGIVIDHVDSQQPILTGKYGIGVESSDHVTIANSTLNGLYIGAYVTYSNTTTITNVTFRNITYAGVYFLQVNRSTVHQSTLHNMSPATAIMLIGSSRNTFVNLSIAGSTNAFHMSLGGYDNIIADSNFTDKTDNVILADEDYHKDVFINVTIINSNFTTISFDNAVSSGGYQFIIQYPIRFYINQTNGTQVIQPTVAALSKSDRFNPSRAGGNDGFVGPLNLTERIINSSGSYTEMPHKLTVSQPRYVTHNSDYSFSGGNLTWRALDPYPLVNITQPMHFFSNVTPVYLSCNVTDYDSGGVSNISLYTNSTGEWLLNQSVMPPEQMPYYNKTFVVYGLDEGTYTWNCLGWGISNKKWNINRTFTMMRSPETPPQLSINVSGMNVTINWTNGTRAYNHTVYWSDSPDGTFHELDTVITNIYNSTLNMSTKYFKVASRNPVNVNFSDTILAVNRYHLARQSGGRAMNWIAIPVNDSSLMKAKDLLNRIDNVTAVSYWNQTRQQSVTCNEISCPNTCTPTACNFWIIPGQMYELSLNTSGPVAFNWTFAGDMLLPTSIELKKDPNGYGKNWITVTANTTLTNAQDLKNSIPNVVSVTRRNETTQANLGFLNIGPGIGKNFAIDPFIGYSVVVSANNTWNQP